MYYNSPYFQKVYLEPTNRCTFSCWFCPRRAMTRKKGDMSLGNYKKLIDSLDDLKYLRYIILGIWGEPTLNKDIFDMISYTKQKSRYQLNITTNGSKFKNKDFCLALLKSGIDKVMISFRTTNKNDINKNLPENMNYQRYVDAILDFIQIKYQYNLDTKIQICLFKDTFYSKYSLKQKTDQFIDRKTINDLFVGISKIINRKVPTYEEMTKSFSSKLSNASVININDDLLIEMDALSLVTTLAEKYKNINRCLQAKYGACLGLHNHFSVLWSGEVTTCYADMEAKNSLGNVFQESIMDILSSDKSIHIYNSLRKHKMPTLACRVCRGGLNHAEKWCNFLGNILFYNKYMIKRIPPEDWMVKRQPDLPLESCPGKAFST